MKPSTFDITPHINIESRKKKEAKEASLLDKGVSVKRRILDLIVQHPEITVNQMAEALSLNERTIYRHITR